MKNKRVIRAISALCDRSPVCAHCMNTHKIMKNNYKPGQLEVYIELFCRIKQREVYGNRTCNKFTF